MRLFHFSIAIALLLSANSLSAQVTNIGTINVGNADFYPTFKTTIGNNLFFLAPADRRTGEYGNDIWVSDGTPSGTKALNIKQLTSQPLERNDSLIFYSAYTDINTGNAALWQLDGQTLQQTKVFSGFDIGTLIQKTAFIYFTAKETSVSNDYFLFNFNIETKQLNKIAPSTPNLRDSYKVGHYSAFNDSILLYYAYKQSNNLFVGYELWRTNGTPQGTFKLDTSRSYLPNLHSFKGKFYLNQREPSRGGESTFNSWATDGASKPTKLPYNLDFTSGVFTDKGFIGVGRDSIHGTDLWFSDLSNNAARNIGDLDTTRYSTFKDNRYVLEKAGCYPNTFTKLNNKVYFFAFNDSCSLAFYETDGTQIGTKLVKPLVKKTEASYQERARQPFVANGKIYAEILTPQNGNEMFVSDGTTEGTKILDVWKGGGNSSYWERYRSVDFTDKNVYFVANNGISGTQIWQANGRDDALKRISNNPIRRGWEKTYTLGSLNAQFIFMTIQDTTVIIWRYDEAKPTALTEDTKRQNYKWLTSFGAIGFASGNTNLVSIATDAKQNTFVLGEDNLNRFAFFDTNQQLIKNKKNVGSYYGGNLFIAKYDSLGKLVWSKDLFSATGSYTNRKKMAVDAEGNIYIAAQNRFSFSGLRRDIYVDNILIHSGSGNVNFILKFNADGQLLWFKKSFMSSNDADFLNIAVKEEHVYLTGKNQNSFLFDNLTVPAGLFVLKMNEAGQTQWATKLSADVKLETVNLTIDNAGNLITLDDKGTLSKVRSSDGSLAWTKKGPLSIDSKMTTQNDGSVFILTDFKGSVSFDNKSVTTDKSAGLALFGIDTDGTVFHSKVLSQNALLTPLTLTSDGKGVFKAIYYSVKDGVAALKFPNWKISNRSSIIARQFTATGLEVAQREIFISDRERGSLKAEFDNQDDFVISGRNVEYIDTIPNIPLSYQDHNVLARFSLRGKLVEAKDEMLKLDAITLSPNPASNILTLSSNDGDFRDANILIYNILGQVQIVNSTHSDGGIKSLNIAHLNKGVYVLIIQRGKEILTKKFSKF